MMLPVVGLTVEVVAAVVAGIIGGGFSTNSGGRCVMLFWRYQSGRI
jgi:hypothetical protein